MQSLHSQQQNELTETLRSHGVQLDFSGYKLLHKVSSVNRERLVPKAISLPESWDHIEKAIDQLRLVFTHSTNNFNFVKAARTKKADLMLSARQLGQGTHSNNYYCKNFLGSDNHVFFTVSFQPIDRLVRGLPTHYGIVPIVPRDAYARERGFIGAFNMYPRDLLSAVSRCRGVGSETQRLLLHPPSQKLSPANRKLWEQMKEQLWRFHFTIEDYEYVFKNLLKKAVREHVESRGRRPSLSFISAEGEHNWRGGRGLESRVYSREEISSILTHGQAQEIWFLVYEMFRRVRNFSIYVEMRIPVAVPAKQIKIQEPYAQ